MASRIERVRNLLTANSTVTTAVVATSIMANYFPDGNEGWPQPGVILSTDGSPEDEQTQQQDLIFGVRCYGGPPSADSDPTDIEAETLYQIIRTALTGKPEFGALESDTAQRALWLTQGIVRLMEEVGGQRFPEPQGTPRGAEAVLASFKAIFSDT